MTGNAGREVVTLGSPSDRGRVAGDGTPCPPTQPTIMIVDDEPDQLMLLGTYFRRAGCVVIAACDAEHALGLGADLPLALMVLDLRLPGVDGWRLAETLRSRYPDCPIAISSVLDVEDYPNADAVLPKPVTGAQVNQLVARLRASTLRRERA